LTDREREQIDADTKGMLRGLNASIRTLEEAEQIRQDTKSAITRQKYARLGLGALGSWAAGGAGQSKSHEQELEEVKANTISAHRDSVLWYLRQKLQECAKFQSEMMEKRLMRELEKNKSMLARSRKPLPDLGGFEGMPTPLPKASTSTAAHMEAQNLYPEEELSPEQLQMFEKQNQDMLKHYESTLDQVKYVFCHSSIMIGLTVSQNCRKVSDRNIRATDTTRQQSGDTISPHRAARSRLFPDDRERGRW